jgi:hypothetical protein
LIKVGPPLFRSCCCFRLRRRLLMNKICPGDLLGICVDPFRHRLFIPKRGFQVGFSLLRLLRRLRCEPGQDSLPPSPSQPSYSVCSTTRRYRILTRGPRSAGRLHPSSEAVMFKSLRRFKQSLSLTGNLCRALAGRMFASPPWPMRREIEMRLGKVEAASQFDAWLRSSEQRQQR